MISDADLREALDADIVLAIREAAKEVTGGNCAFADDDAALLGRLALRAVKANLIWGFDKPTTRNLERVRDGLEPHRYASGTRPRENAKRSRAKPRGPTREAGDAHA